MTAENDGAESADPQAPLAVFLINLDRSPDRRAAMTGQLRRLGISFRRISAADGRELGEEELKETSDPERMQQNIGRLMTRGEIGCCLSHLKVYRIMVEENIQSALVLEDDLTLNEDFAEALEGWSRTPGYCRTLQLAVTSPITRAQKKCFSRIGNVRFPAGYVAARNYDTTDGAMAYIIRRSYAEELLQTAFPVQAPIDTALFDWRFNYYIPWILYKEKKSGNGAVLSPAVHLPENSLLERERHQSVRERPALRRATHPKNLAIKLIVRFYKALKKYAPLPFNRGRKFSFFEIDSRHSTWRHLQAAASSLAPPGRNRCAEILRAEPPPPVFVINMKESLRRRAFMRRQLDDLNLDFEFIEAVDGNEIPESELKKICPPEAVRKKFQRELLPGEIGCHLSHMKAYEIMLERNLPEAVILEDDALLNEEFAELLNSWKLPEQCPILQLSSGSPIFPSHARFFSPHRVIRLPNDYRIIRRAGVVYGTQAYWIRQSYARRMLREKTPIRAPIDLLLFDSNYNFRLPWIICRAERRENGKRVHATPASHHIYLERVIGYEERRSSKFHHRVMRWAARNAEARLNGWILRWIWPWNCGEKRSLLQFAGKPGVLRRISVILSCYFPGPQPPDHRR